MGNAPKKDLQDIAIELQLTSRQMEKQAQKLEAKDKAEKKRIREVSSCFCLTKMRVGPGQRSNGKCEDLRRKRNSEQKRGT